MSDYGSDKNVDLNIARKMIFANNFMPMSKSNSMQWTYADGTFVQKYARRADHSNIHFKIDRSKLVEL